MKTFFKFLTFTTIILSIVLIASYLIAEYQYSNKIQSYWELADKASTIDQKSEYLSKFIVAIEDEGLGGHNAIVFKTPDNSYDENIKALKSLQSRLDDIKDMDVTSFEYNTAIQQITAQEQGEASQMITVIKQIWYKNHYFLLWDWVGGLLVFFVIFFLTFDIVGWIMESINNN